MPKTTKVKKKVKKVKAKSISKSKPKVVAKPVAIKSKEINKGPIKISKNYEPKETEKYMCDKHKVFF
jgi:DnaK suppressor protein